MSERLSNHVFLDASIEDGSLYKRIARSAESLAGSPSTSYRGPESGMNPEEGFECSGFVTYILKESGVVVPEGIRHVNEYFDTYGIMIQYGLQKAGDLIFFSYDGMRPTHMGIVLSEDAYIHAPGKENTTVEIKSIQEEQIALREREYHHYHTNPIGIKRPMEKMGRYQLPLGAQVFPKRV